MYEVGYDLVGYIGKQDLKKQNRVGQIVLKCQMPTEGSFGLVCASWLVCWLAGFETQGKAKWMQLGGVTSLLQNMFHFDEC